MKDQQPDSTSRRNFISSASLLAAGYLVLPKLACAQAQSPVVTIINAAKSAKINTIKLRKNICVLDGSGGNIAVLHGKEGKLLVDGGIGVSKPNVLAALNAISADPLKYLINTHWHFDHTFGNEWLHQAGATIIAQETTRKHLAESTRVDDWNYPFPPLPKAGLPTTVFKTRHNMLFNGEKIHIETYPHSHTDSDSSVFFADANILHVGDTFWNGYYPFIDYSTGGSITGMLEAARININKVNKDTIVIPGHGPIGDKQHLVEFYDMLTTVYEKVAAYKKQGKSIKEILAAKPTAEYDAKYGGFVIDGAFFTRLVYKGL